MNCLEHFDNGAFGNARKNEVHRRIGRGGSLARWFDWVPVVVLPPMAILLFSGLAAWVLMWAICFALYAGCKWLTWRQARLTEVPGWRNWAYLFLWPGLDARTFLDPRQRAGCPSIGEWMGAIIKIILGAVLVWGAVGHITVSQALLKGWIGMAGMILMLHFGSFHLLALMWRRFGINARPLMRAPILANSLADFWGRRWNSAFNQLIHDLVFRPLHRRIGVAGATMAGFLASGLVHDLVISVPARAGYALPTAYFLLQGLGVVLERSNIGRRVGLRHGFTGRCFTIAITAGPAFYLFHPPFIKNVILPMLHVIGAT